MRKVVLSIVSAALSLPAFGQTPDAGPVVAAHIRPGHALPDASGKGKTSVTAISKATTSANQSSSPAIWAQVPRYQKTLIATQVAYYANSCAFFSSGIVTFPTPPQYGTATTGTTSCTIPQGQACAGHSYSNCAAVYYERTARNNKSLRTPSAEGPIDLLTYKWDVPGYFTEYHSPDVAVPTVHPIGETIEFKGFYQVPAFGFYGKWVSKLTPPTDDATFDFEGDTVKESHLVQSNGCQARAPAALGDPSSSGGIAIGKAATWKVGEYTLAGTNWPAPKNYFGFDLVGWSACTVQAYRCAGVTEPYCGTRLRQTMHHHAQSDYPDFFVAYQDNELGEEIGGRVLPDPNPNKTSIGFITSSKNTTQTLPNAVMNLTYCPFLSTLKDRLPKCFSDAP